MSWRRRLLTTSWSPCASRWSPRRLCTEGALLAVGARACSRRTEASLSYRCGAVGSSEAPPRHREVELSACCTAAVSRRSRSLSWTHHPSEVEGLGIVQSSITAATMFWLARLKMRVYSTPSSLLMRRLTSRALRQAAPPSLRPRCSRSRVSPSCCRRRWSCSTLA